MKRINGQWWKDIDGYYIQTSPHVYEGPFDSMDNKDPINLYNPPKESGVVDSGVVELQPVSKSTETCANCGGNHKYEDCSEDNWTYSEDDFKQ